jgi:type IV pilus assembly protein PilQ
VFILNYAKARDIVGSITPLIDTTKGGRVQTDDRINAMIISERASLLGKVRTIIDKLDRATEQVMIESKYVEVTNRDIKNIGVNWASLQNYQIGASDLNRERTRTQSNDRTSGNDSSFTNTNTTTTSGSPAVTAVENEAEIITSQLAGLTKANGVNTITSSVFSAGDFNIILSALQGQNETKLISNPTLVTLNNTEASINIGEEFPIPSYTYNQERGSFEVSGFDYKNIGIQLKVTPQVNAQGFIRLILEPEVSSQAGETSFGGAGGATIPIIATRKTKTQVTLKDGYTMGIGGLVENVATNGDSRVPGLGNIPYLGRLFRSNNKTENGRNLLIFITAKTVSPDGAPIGETFDPRLVRDMEVKKEDLPGYRDGSDPFGPSDRELAEAAKKQSRKKK